jgi:predicted dehydrogenase
MRIVFIGTGAVFTFHSSDFMYAAPDGSEFAFVDPDDAAAAMVEGEKFRRLTLEQAVEWAEAAVIMTPSYVRWSVCEPFIRKGTPIAVEKPLTISWKEIELFAEAAKAGAWICPIVNIRAIGAVEEMKQKSVGIKHVRSWKLRNRAPGYYTGWHGRFATDGGVLAQQGFHCLDLVCWFGGQPVAVTAKGENRQHKIECEDTATVTVEFANGVTGEVFCTTADECGFVGDAGLHVDSALGPMRTRGGMFARMSNGHRVIAERMFAAIGSGSPPPITVDSMVPSLRALHACYVSMDRGGERVEIGAEHSRLGVQ